jgi:hypothetical protein
MKYHYQNHCFTKEMKRKRERFPVMDVWLYFERIQMGETKGTMSLWKVLHDEREERKETDDRQSNVCSKFPFFFLPFMRPSFHWVVLLSQTPIPFLSLTFTDGKFGWGGTFVKK